MFKKIASLLLVTVLALGLGTNTVTFGKVNQNGFNQEEIRLLEKQNINVDKIEKLELEEAFSKEEIENIKLLNEEIEKDGSTLKNMIVYQDKTQNNDIDAKYVPPIDDGRLKIKKINVYRNIVTKPEQINDSKWGVGYWSDVAFNLTIGQYTKYTWKVATFFGINPSNFYTEYVQGDMITSTYAKNYTDVHYKYKGGNSPNTYVSGFVKTKLSLTHYLDLYTVDKNNNSVRERDNQTRFYYTENYFDEDWIKEIVEYQSEYTSPRPPYTDKFH